MKVLYIIDQSMDKGLTSGIITKIKDKISLWKKEDVEVDILSLYSVSLYNSKLECIKPKKIHLEKHGRIYTLYRLLVSTFYLYLFLRKNTSYDLIYIRQRPYMPFLRCALKNQKVVIEVNTDDVLEYKSLSLYMHIYNSITRKWFYSLACGFVSVTNELALRFSLFKKPTITIANGIRVNNYPEVQGGETSPTLLFVGSPGFTWHGYEKIEWLAMNCPDFNFHIMGINGVDTKNLKYFGYLELDEVKEHAMSSDVGISTLSLHTKGMDEACPLKSRQYLAQGLPIIYAYKDTDLMGDEAFALKLPNSENNIRESLELIREFVSKVRLDKTLSKQARVFAEKKLDVSTKEKSRVEFLRSFL